ncbi:hypothetical protein ACFXKX_28460 [Streptomyces scopuliridis]|uniref:hypothetical protein n=1 Tax=Streptomyces scopuliridis TaxID=452529 RepID=UPI003675DC4C
MLGLKDDLYQRVGAPEGYRPFDRETEDGTTHVVWYRVIHYAPPTSPSRPSWLRRLFGGGTTPEDGHTEPPEPPQNTERPD